MKSHHFLIQIFKSPYHEWNYITFAFIWKITSLFTIFSEKIAVNFKSLLVNNSLSSIFQYRDCFKRYMSFFYLLRFLNSYFWMNRPLSNVWVYVTCSFLALSCVNIDLYFILPLNVNLYHNMFDQVCQKYGLQWKNDSEI